jgi:hypothetical protein
MVRYCLIVSCVFGVLLAQAAFAGDQPGSTWSWHRSPAVDTNGCHMLCGCPNDYCRKPWPCLQPVPCIGGPDDYCRKPFPCLIPVQYCGTHDDYCRKPWPCLLCPPTSPFLSCGIPEVGCNSSGAPTQPSHLP